ncbi:ketopantoate reductase family protein [Candidatus Poriferisocius sp.]|uniref:ketopantoate reductase family protein n=1 Tax=Candidatus Poriferisocius sp. TaxID=3101276 RepID=UPI003B02C349
MHVVVAGAGGIGGAIAGEVAFSGRQVSVIDAWADHVEAIRADGLRLTGPSRQGERTARLPAWHIDEWPRLAPIDLLVIAAKAFDNQWLAPLLAPRLADAATVISAQNGVNEPLLAELLGSERVIGTVVLFPAEALGPGLVRLDRHPTLQIGELDGTRTDRLEQVSSTLGPGIDVAASDNIWGAIWSKLVMNCMSNPVNAVLGGRARVCREQPGPRRVSLACGSEAVAVGQAQGHQIEPVSGIDAERILVGGAGGPGADDLAADWEATAAEVGEVKGSMPTDIERGRKTEIDSFSGFVRLEGMRLGIPTPANDAVYEMVGEIESGARVPSPQNLGELLKALG